MLMFMQGNSHLTSFFYYFFSKKILGLMLIADRSLLGQSASGLKAFILSSFPLLED
jgi:hypothetical protein